MLHLVVSIALNVSVLGASANAAMLDTSTDRLKYSNCMTEFTVDKLKSNMSNSAFMKAVDTACTKEREAYVASVKKDEIDFGSSQSEAAEFATEEADSVLSSFTSAYQGYLDTNSSPEKEKAR